MNNKRMMFDVNLLIAFLMILAETCRFFMFFVKSEKQLTDYAEKSI